MFCLQKRWKRVRFGESREPGVFLFLGEVSPNLSSLVEKKHVKKDEKGSDLEKNVDNLAVYLSKMLL